MNWKVQFHSDLYHTDLVFETLYTGIGETEAVNRAQNDLCYIEGATSFVLEETEEVSIPCDHRLKVWNKDREVDWVCNDVRGHEGPHYIMTTPQGVQLLLQPQFSDVDLIPCEEGLFEVRWE